MEDASRATPHQSVVISDQNAKFSHFRVPQAVSLRAQVCGSQWNPTLQQRIVIKKS